MSKFESLRTTPPSYIQQMLQHMNELLLTAPPEDREQAIHELIEQTRQQATQSRHNTDISWIAPLQLD